MGDCPWFLDARSPPAKAPLFWPRILPAGDVNRMVHGRFFVGQQLSVQV